MLSVSQNNRSLSSLSISKVASGNKSKNTSSANLDVSADPFYGLSFNVGVAENKNTTYRAKMEDVHTYVANFAERLDWGYFAIFDGHAGKQTARWCGNNLHTLVENEILSREELKEKTSNSDPAASSGNYDIKDVLHNAFVRADELIEEEGNGSSGCTAAVAVLRWETEDQPMNANTKIDNNSENGPSKFDFIPGPNHKRMLYTSNVGDLRIILYRAGKPYRLSYDHKASDENEINRIRDQGGLVMKNRVNGVLAVTRSLGDTYMKNLVIGKPFTTSTEITPEDEFFILACDGVWDVISDLKACQFVAEVFRQQNEANQPIDTQSAARKLCQLAMDNATTDNVTVMVVKLEKSVFNPQLNTQSH